MGYHARLFHFTETYNNETKMSNQTDVRWAQEPNCTTCAHVRPFYIENGRRIERMYCSRNEYPVNSRICCEEYERKQEDNTNGKGN